MKKITIMLCLLGGILGGTELKWLEPHASYRVQLRQKGTPATPHAPAAVVPARWLWPAPAALGARAFLSNKVELPLQWDRSHRALLLPGCAQDREIFLYCGFNPEHALTLPVESALDREFLSFHEVAYWRQHGNFKHFLADKKRRITRQMQNSYNALHKNLQRHRADRLLFPPRSGKNPVVAYWDLNRAYQDHLGRPGRERLWLSQALRGQEWRLFQSEAMRSFYFDRNLYRNRIFWSVNSFRHQSERQQLSWQKFLTMDRHEAIFGDLLKNFDRRLQNFSAVPRDLDKLKLCSRELDLHGRSSLRLQGNLVVPKTGEYEFKVESEAMWQWELAGKVFWQALAAHPEQGRSYEFRQPLSKGTWPWKFYFSRCETSGNFTILWRRIGSTVWRVLEQSDFAPAPEVEVQKIILRDGGAFPLIPRTHLRFFMVDKQHFKAVEKLTLPPGMKIYYQNQPFPAKSGLVALSGSRGNSDFELFFAGRRWAWPAADMWHSPVVEPGNLFMTFNLPATRFHDEKLPLQIEVFNQFPQTLAAVVAVRVKALNSRTPELTQLEPLDLAPQSHKLVTLPGILQNQNAEIELELLVAGHSFQILKLQICQPHNLPQVVSVSGNLLRQSDQVPVCLTVKRRSLSDLREWQLLKLLKFHAIHQVAIIGAGEYGKKLWQQKFPGALFEFTQWQPPARAVAGGSALAHWFNWWQNLSDDCTFDAVIWHPSAHERNFWGERDYWRLLGGAVELMRHRFPDIKIFLVFPEKSDASDCQIFSRFVREYDLQLE